ncbi:hypothetical protein [Candidatus Erwinia haradaeae]|nr:hypothetical protein [Candidatus Erwinia haradaeae]
MDITELLSAGYNGPVIKNPEMFRGFLLLDQGLMGSIRPFFYIY